MADPTDRAPQYASYAQAPPKFIAGPRGLDFVNTVEWRGDPAARFDRLVSYDELALWCVQGNLIEKGEAGQLMRAARKAPRDARRVLRQAVDLREAVAAMLRKPAEQRGRELQDLNLRLEAVHCHLALEPGDAGTLRSVFVLLGPVVERLLGLVALEMVEFLTSGQIDRVRACANPRCGWMFVDTSRNRSRRWCDMSSCGNRAKVRAHYVRSTGR